MIAGSPALFPPPPPEMPCIRCGECAEACPHELQPFEMYWFSREELRQGAGIQPSSTASNAAAAASSAPRVSRWSRLFRFAKSEIWSREREKKPGRRRHERASNSELPNATSARKRPKAERCCKPPQRRHLRQKPEAVRNAAKRRR